ncbi:MAG TPA: adenylate/guanylate cyclase domain-containing protein, partial [Alphaproteobacteria bacterium]|nr:adenylate/guanylate cyclase domain-containing protein [Alphaproteobacteria bacterium]
PEDALFAATAVNDAVKRLPDQEAFTLRVGINLGPVKVVVDLNGQPNIIGDGINVAQRVMSFADEGEILVSRSYYEVVARLQEGNERLFRYLGVRKDKHVREHQVYAFGGSEMRPCAPAATTTPFDEDAVAVVEQRLARVIGPMARVMVARAAKTASTVAALCESVAAVVPDEADRAAFLEACLEIGGNKPPLASAAAAPANFDAAALAQVERRLAEHIGPLAPMLVRRAAKDAVDITDLYARLARGIEDETARKRFLAAAKNV